MKNILFVDDEQRILDGLRASLRRQRTRWNMVFAPGGEQALAELEKTDFDVIVTDMRMPKVDGAALLRHVQQHCPQMVRIVLSGFAEEEAILRTLPVAHQFLNKPCDATTLENVIERACNIQLLLEKPEIRAAVGNIESLPALPKHYNELNKVIADEHASLQDIAAIIERDIGMSAKLLQIVNSAFFGISRKLASICDTIGYLGLHVIKNLVLSVEIFRTFEDKELASEISLDSLHRHSLLVARIARRLMDDPEAGKDAFAAAILHDVGELVLAAFLPEVITASIEKAKQEELPLYVAEKKLHGFSHADVGAYLLGQWGLPYPLIEAVAFHHVPRTVNQSCFDILSAVHIADGLSYEVEVDIFGPSPLAGSIDMDYMEQLGVADRLSEWRNIAEQQAGEATIAGS